MPRLLLVAMRLCSIAGGGEISNLKIIEKLSDRAELIVVSLTDTSLSCLPDRVEGLTLNPGMDTDRLVARYARGLKILGRLPRRVYEALSKLIGAVKPDAVIAMDHYTASIASMASRRVPSGVIVRNNVHPAILSEYTGRVKRMIYAIYSTATCRALRGVHTIYTVSNYLRWELVKTCNLDPRRVIIDAFDPLDEEELREAARRAESLNALVFAGRLEEYKGVALLLAAYAKAASRLDFELVVVGAGPLEPLVRRVAGRLGRVRYLGRKPHLETLRLIASSVAVAYPVYTREPFGRTAMEAVALNKPVITSLRGGLLEALGEAKRLGVPYYPLSRLEVDELVEALLWANNLERRSPMVMPVWSLRIDSAIEKLLALAR